jgi:hypothetical protein
MRRQCGEPAVDMPYRSAAGCLPLLLHLQHIPHREAEQEDEDRRKQLLNARCDCNAARHIGHRIAPLALDTIEAAESPVRAVAA